jgi:serine/threonine protein kinase
MYPPGHKLAGYEILGELGRGSTGIVYKVRHAGLKRFCVLKIPLPEPESQTERLERFFREAKALAHLTGPHEPNIPQLNEVAQFQDQVFYSREFVDGDTLTRQCQFGSIGLKKRVTVLAAVADTVRRVHERGFAHRNLHPSNILIGENGEPKLIGFGLVGTRDWTHAGIRKILGVRVTDDLDALQQTVCWVGSTLKPPIPQVQDLMRECEATTSVAELASVLRSFLST